MKTKIFFIISIVLLGLIRSLGTTYFNNSIEILIEDLVIYAFVLLNGLFLFGFNWNSRLLWWLSLICVLLSALNFTSDGCSGIVKTRIFQTYWQYYNILSIIYLVLILTFLILEVLLVVKFVNRANNQNNELLDGL